MYHPLVIAPSMLAWCFSKGHAVLYDLCSLPVSRLHCSDQGIAGAERRVGERSNRLKTTTGEAGEGSTAAAGRLKRDVITDIVAFSVIAFTALDLCVGHSVC